MDIKDTENPFGDGVDNRGVDDDDDENIPLVSTSSRRGSEDKLIAPPIQELTEKHLLLEE